jgi:ubiquitin-protein ligase E3 C
MLTYTNFGNRQTSSFQLVSLLLNSSTYPHRQEDEKRIRIITYALHNTALLKSMKHAILSSTTGSTAIEEGLLQLVALKPPYYYTTSPLIEKHQTRPATRYLTRPNLVRMLTLDLFAEPFLLDHTSSATITQLTKQLPLNDVLESVTELFMDPNVALSDTAVAGLLMNITIMGDVESGVHIDNVLVKSFIH